MFLFCFWEVWKIVFYICSNLIFVKDLVAEYVAAQFAYAVKPVYKRKQIAEYAFYDKLYLDIKKAGEFPIPHKYLP